MGYSQYIPEIIIMKYGHVISDWLVTIEIKY